jgi:arylsulfatase A-like enzyme
MFRRTLIAAMAACAAVALAGCAAGAPEAPASSNASAEQGRPNIIVIMADDLGFADVSAYRKGRIPTPHIDRLAQQGVLFTRGYVTAPICSPSRAGLMTGRHQQRYGFEYNNGPAARDFRERLGLDTREKTLGDLLKAGGYRTGVIGKWHLGAADEHYPTRRGFDEWWGFLTGQTNFIDPNAPNAVNGAPVRPAGAAGGDLSNPAAVVNPLNAIITGPDRQPVDLGQGFLTEQLTEQAIAFVDRSGDQPFFLYLAHHAPHTPLQVTRKYYDRFPQIADRESRVYAGMVSALDDGVGQLMAHLERKGLAQNTLVVFLSDNGCAAYLDGICSDEPISGGKLTYLEGGVRVPFVAKWPAGLPAGRVYDAPVSSLDILPTALAAAGVPLPADRPYDGFNLLPYLNARQAPARPAPLFWRTQPSGRSWTATGNTTATSTGWSTSTT